MFQNMSPKILNVEKLEKKFASLTKSKESIQGLSVWIIRHKEFYTEIVNQWFDALTRDSNALNMFYVANDVIQNCGRKKAPEFREAFATVLEQACSLEKVKEIKNEVMRMLTLWHERSIYDDVFYKKLVDTLNSENEVESENEELDEADVIANFKLENLINSLKKLKTLEDELSVKEAFLEDIEEPAITNLDNLIVRMESQKELKKVDKFQKLVEEYLSLSDKVMLAKKSALLNLNYSTIFYSAQFRDADKVAQAYRIYGKKVNNVKKSLSEKILTFPEPSPIAEEENSNAEFNSSTIHISPNILQTSAINNNLIGSYPQERLPSPKNSENNLVLSSSNDKSESSLERRILQSPSITSSKNLNEHIKPSKSPISDTTSSSKKDRKQSLSPSSDIVKSKENVLKNTLKSPIPDVIKSSKSDRKQLLSPSLSDILKSNESVLKSPVLSVGENKREILLKSPTINDVKKSSTANILKSPSESSTAKSSNNESKSKCLSVSNTEKSAKENDKCLKEFMNEDIFKGGIDDKKPENVLNIEHHVTSDDNHNISESRENSSSAKNKSDSYSKKSESEEYQGLSDFENIDFLLEKAYDERRSKSKLSIKRKIDNLLKSKQSKACKLSTEEDTENKSVSNIIATETPMDIAPSPASDGSNLNEKLCNEQNPVVRDNDKTSEATNINTIEKSGEGSNLEETKDQDLNHTNKMPAKSLDSETPKSISLPLQALPDIPTELLKNILNKHKTNLNSTLNTESSNLNTEAGTSANELSNSSTTNNNQFTFTQTNTDISVKSKIPDSSSTMGASNTEVSKIENSNKCSQEMLDENVKKCDPVSDADFVHDKSTKIKSALLGNLQDILKCFTQKESRFDELKNSNTLNNMPSIPLENTLKIYSYIMQSCSNANSLGLSNNSDKAPALKSNSLETAPVDKELPCVNYHKANDCFDPKSENLEIMDMELDSDDENS